MHNLKCSNCGAIDFEETDNYLVCSYCGSKFVKKETGSQQADFMVDEVATLLEKCKKNPAKARRYANLILDIDPGNIEAKKYL